MNHFLGWDGQGDRFIGEWLALASEHFVFCRVDMWVAPVV